MSSSCRKRRSNRLTVEQLAAKREAREEELNRTMVMLVTYGHEDLSRPVSLRMALELERDGDAEKLEIETANGIVAVWRELKPLELPTQGSPSMLTLADAEAVAGARTWQAQGHLARVIMFPFERDRKAPLVGPRVTQREVDQARSLMRRFEDRPARIQVLRNDVAAAA